MWEGLHAVIICQLWGQTIHPMSSPKQRKLLGQCPLQLSHALCPQLSLYDAFKLTLEGVFMTITYNIGATNPYSLSLIASRLRHDIRSVITFIIARTVNTFTSGVTVTLGYLYHLMEINFLYYISANVIQLQQQFVSLFKIAATFYFHKT